MSRLLRPFASYRWSASTAHLDMTGGAIAATDDTRHFPIGAMLGTVVAT
jgi:hypothetical protein